MISAGRDCPSPDPGSATGDSRQSLDVTARPQGSCSSSFLLGLVRAALRVGRCWRRSMSCASVSVAVASASTCSSEISARYCAEDSAEPVAVARRARRFPLSVRSTRTTRPSPDWRVRVTSPFSSSCLIMIVIVGCARPSSSASSVIRREPPARVLSRPSSVRESSPPSCLTSSRVSNAARGSSSLAT